MMPRPTGPTNPRLQAVIKRLEKEGKKRKVRVWLKAAELLSRPRRKRVEVNLSKINRLAREGETILVPGVVLGCGNLTKAVTVSAFRFSRNAREKIEGSGGRAIGLQELLEENPNGKRILIVT